MSTTSTMFANSDTKSQSSTKDKSRESDVAHGLRSLFLDGLKDIYFAENALTKAIPKMISNATDPHLLKALTGHLEETKMHVTRLEQVFASLGEKVEAKTCQAIVGLTKEAEEIMASTERGMVRDAGIIAAGQKVEHYEIATYGTLCSFAKTLGESKAVTLLQQTLNEEKGADMKLTEIAESFINAQAVNAN
jgi:ferritin-like metal-binding protein YciE